MQPCPQNRDLPLHRKSNHPWIFQKMVEKPNACPRKRREIVDRDGQVGKGFTTATRITARSTTGRRASRGLFARRLAPSAAAAIEPMLSPRHRLVPRRDDLRLVVDRFDPLWCSSFSRGMFRCTIFGILLRQFPGALYWFAEEHVRSRSRSIAGRPNPRLQRSSQKMEYAFALRPGASTKRGFSSISATIGARWQVSAKRRVFWIFAATRGALPFTRKRWAKPPK